MSALSTKGLSRSFGALAVARDINFDLPAGARHALIGPNGAGKTTFLNLLTGALAPSAGRVLLGDADITGLPTHRRVRMGLARTFQINSLFPDFTPLEAVVMTILEREGAGGRLLSGFRRHTAQVDEAHALLVELKLGEDVNRRTRELPYGRQRLLEIGIALALKPRVLLLDEPAAGVPAQESHELFEAIAALPAEIAILFIEHDMDLVFRFARRITVLVAGQVLCEGSPAEIAEDPRVREVYLGNEIMPAPLLEISALTAGYAESVVLHDVTLSLTEGDRLAVLGRNGMGKTTLLATIMGHTTRHAGGIFFAGQDISRSRPHLRARAGIGWVAQEREIFPSLTVEENLTVAARPGRWMPRAVYDLFPRLYERRASMGNQLSGGEQQMLAIGRALATNPRLILLDEPLEGLAPVIVDQLIAAIRRMTDEYGLSAIIVEQHAETALDLAETALVLDRGRVAWTGPAAALRADSATLDRLVGVRRT